MANKYGVNPLTEFWNEHMAICGPEGSGAPQFRQAVYDALPDRPDLQEAINAKSADAVINQVWKQEKDRKPVKRKKGDPIQLELMLGGMVCPRCITYSDSQFPGGYRTVLFALASPYQLDMACDDHYRQERELKEAGDELRAIRDIARERCGGDMNVSLQILTDDFFGAEEVVA